MTRRLVIVSGAPGVGKSTLAVPLAKELDLPLFSKDHVKEVLHDSLPSRPGTLQASREYGAAAMELIWAMASRCPQVVLEANFLPGQAGSHLRAAAFEGAEIVELHCRCAPEEAVRRYAQRAPNLHPVHVVQEISVATVHQYGQPLGFGPVISVDTSFPVNVPALAAQVRKTWPIPAS